MTQWHALLFTILTLAIAERAVRDDIRHGAVWRFFVALPISCVLILLFYLPGMVIATLHLVYRLLRLIVVVGWNIVLACVAYLCRDFPAYGLRLSSIVFGEDMYKRRYGRPYRRG